MEGYNIYLLILGFIIYVFGREFVLQKIEQRKIKKLLGDIQIKSEAIKSHTSSWDVFINTSCFKEKSIQKNLLKKDKIFQKLYTEYVSTKFRYFEKTNGTLFQKEIFEIIELSNDPEITQKAINHLLEKNDFYEELKKQQSTI